MEEEEDGQGSLTFVPSHDPTKMPSAPTRLPFGTVAFAHPRSELAFEKKTSSFQKEEPLGSI